MNSQAANAAAGGSRSERARMAPGAKTSSYLSDSSVIASMTLSHQLGHVLGRDPSAIVEVMAGPLDTADTWNICE